MCRIRVTRVRVGKNDAYIHIHIRIYIYRVRRTHNVIWRRSNSYNYISVEVKFDDENRKSSGNYIVIFYHFTHSIHLKMSIFAIDANRFCEIHQLAVDFVK